MAALDVVRRDELAAPRTGLLVSHEEPLGRDRFDEWLERHGARLDRSYTSELRRTSPHG